MAKVVVTAALPGAWREILAAHEIVALEEIGEAEALLPLLSVRVDAALLASAQKLRIVANYAVGVDNIDVPACTARKVVVTNTPGVLTEATADLTMALMLGAARRVGEGDAMIRAGQWRGWEPDQLLGLDLDGATLGIVGLGRIGQAVRSRAQAFGMNVIHSSRTSGVPLDELLAVSDVVSLHCPLTAATRKLIGARELSRMKPTAILVNTARGAIVDESALAEALDRGRPGFAALDVFEDEPRVHEGLVRNRRALLLPHLGSATRGARTRMAEMAAQSIADFLDGKRPEHVVNPGVY